MGDSREQGQDRSLIALTCNALLPGQDKPGRRGLHTRLIVCVEIEEERLLIL